MMRLLLVLAIERRYRSWDEVPLTLTVAEVARVLGISRSSGYRLIERGRIKAVRLSQRKLVVSKQELHRVLGLGSNDEMTTTATGGESDGDER